jgi:hypothetical protein
MVAMRENGIEPPPCGPDEGSLSTSAEGEQPEHQGHNTPNQEVHVVHCVIIFHLKRNIENNYTHLYEWNYY